MKPRLQKYANVAMLASGVLALLSACSRIANDEAVRTPSDSTLVQPTKPGVNSSEPAGLSEETSASLSVAHTLRAEYVVAESERRAPLEAYGFRFTSLGQFRDFDKADDGYQGRVTYGGKQYAFSIEEAASEKPRLRFDLNGDGALGDDELLPQDAAYYSVPGHLAALVPFRAEGLDKQRFHLNCLFGAALEKKGMKPYAYFQNMGMYRARLRLGEGEERQNIALYSFDQPKGAAGNAFQDGDHSNDDLYVDYGDDGIVCEPERVKIGETFRYAGFSIRVESVSADGVTFKVSVEPGGTEGRDLDAEMALAPLPGNPFPDFEFTDQNGKIVSKESVKGKVVLVNFWGAW